MKSAKYLYLLVLAAAFSCKKSDLELFPYNQIETSNAFKTEADVKLAVNGMYAGLRNTANNCYFVDGIWNIMADAMADNLIINTTGPGRLTLRTYSNWQYTGEDTYWLFADGYTLIRRANAILENIDAMPDGDFKNNAKGEALAFRGLVYFDMSRVYSKTYQNASATDWTVPYVTVTDPTITPASEPVHGFYDKVIKDLEDALPLIGTSNGLYRINKGTVSALLSRVYLYKGDYAKCIASANDALGGSPKLPSLATFANIWSDVNEQSDGSISPDNGVFFKVRNTRADNDNTQGVNFYQTVPSGIKSEYVVEYNFRQLFTATDVRTNAYIKTSAYLGNNYNHVVKYAGRSGEPAGVVDAKVIRTAEVLLNRAEAYFRSSPSNEAAALADLQALKKQRYQGYVNEVFAGQALLDEILLQRRLELAFEGDRFWDLKRRNQGVERDATKGDLANGGGVEYVFTSLPAGDYRFNLPYPQREINFNPGIKQNPDY